MSFLRWTAVAALLLTVGSVQAGTIHPALQAEMDQTAAETPISAIVHLTEQAPIAAMSQDLRQTNATRQERHRQVVEALQATARSTQPQLRAYLDDRMLNGDVLGYTTHWISNMIVVYATKAEIDELAMHPSVDRIEPNFTAALIEPIGFVPPTIDKEDETGGLRGIGVTPGLRAIRAPEAWALGFTGAGRLVANLDTGVDGNHPALASRWRGLSHPWQQCWLDVLGAGGSQFPSDGYGHGTHVMGTLTGRGDATGDTVGVSWDAEWIACNAINQGVSGEFDNDITAAFEWFADPDGDPETVDDVPDVVQNSWGINESFGYPDCDTRWWNVIDNCEAAGCVTTWSAGNEGSSPGTLRSPADRATTLTNCFSVGAVDATNYGWPYPIAGFSSRGPSGCTAPPANKIKPEVAAPGVDVYSSVPGGGYQQDQYDGTSMAGPHAAGIVGLLRQANPNLDVDTIKMILMETARDEGTAGEDNDYGWGFVDAHAAVVAATVGFGQLEGHVTNASWSNTPIEDVRIKALDLGSSYFTDDTGFYEGMVPAGLHLLEASHPSFRADTALVEITSDEVTVQDFALIDIAGPTITEVTDNRTTTDTVGPYRIDARVTDCSTVDNVKLYYRVNAAGWTELAMTRYFGDFTLFYADIPGRPAGSQIDYYVQAEDGIGLVSTSPEGAPGNFYSLYITEIIYAYEAETPDSGWQLGAAGDQADAGIWVRADPVGTSWNGAPVQPEDDHTTAPGVQCFVTGNGAVGGAAGEADVDHGCTTLLSPIFDLSDATMAFVTYYRWFGENGNSVDDEFAVDVSNDGGLTWQPLERVPNNDTIWRRITLSINDVVGLTNQIRFRFLACDLNTGGLVEAGIDDFAIETFVPSLDEVAAGDLLRPTHLGQNEPNPFHPATTIRLRLSNPAQALLTIFDTSGRLVRTLVDEPMTAGTHQILWNGLDDQGREVGSGVYFYRFKAGAFEQCRRMTILR